MVVVVVVFGGSSIIVVLSYCYNRSDNGSKVVSCI